MQKVWKLINTGDFASAHALLEEHKILTDDDQLKYVIAKASILISENKHAEALALLEEYPELVAGSSKALGLKAVCLGRLGSSDEAINLFKQAICFASDQGELFHNLSVLYGDLGQWENAHEAAENAAKLASNHLLILLNLGRTLVNLRRGKESLAIFQRCCKLDKTSGDAWAGVGASHLVLNNYKQAISAIKTAIQYKPESGPINANMGIAYKNICEFDLAEKFIGKAVEIDPSYAEHHWNLSLIKLLKGNYLEGWAEYEWRYHPSRTAFDRISIPNLRIPMLKKGDSVSGKTIAIVAEQGLGDCIQFARFAKCIKDNGGRVVLFLPDVVAKVFQTMPWVDAICTTWKNTPHLDAWCFVMSLPYLFTDETNLFDISTPYIFPFEGYVRKWADKIKSEKLRVGLVWAGRPTHGNDANRSMKLDDFKDIIKNKNVQIYSLQMGEAQKQMEGFASQIIDLGTEINDFCDTAGILANLDLLISVDSAPVHIAGAMGLPVWTLVSKVPDYRWGIDGESTPWYQSCRLFRQTRTGDWSGICQNLSKELKEFSPRLNRHFLLQLPEMPFENGNPAPAGYIQYVKYAMALQNQGNEREAQQIYKWALHFDPNQVDVLRNLAVSYRRTKNLELSKELYEQAITLDPNNPLTYSNYCNLLLDLRELEYADKIADKAILLDNKLAPPHYAKSSFALQQKQYGAALKYAQLAAEIEPKNPTFLAMIAQILLREEKLEDAKLYLDKAIEIDSAHPETLIGLGQYYAQVDRPESALKVYQQALKCRSDLPELYSNLAVTFSRLNRYDEAEQMARKAIAIQPDYADAHFNLSLYLLTVGKFREGFAEYEWRYKDERKAKDRTIVPDLTRPQWKGESLAGKTILLYTEQGHGDCIEFLAYTKVLKELGATVYVAVKDALQGLFGSCPWVDKVCYDGEKLSDYDYWTFFMSIPYCLGDDYLRDYPGQYLTPDYAKSKFDIDPFLREDKVNVGIVWSGSPTHGGDRWRSVTPDYFDFLANADGINLIGINRSVEPLSSVLIDGIQVPNVGNLVQDFNELACVINKLDLLISVDSAPAHLAGALDKKVYTLIPFAPDWRWGLESSKTPLYQSMSLIRQAVKNKWSDTKEMVMKKINDDFGLNEKIDSFKSEGTKKKLAVVIPTYNRIDKLKVAIDSVLSQIYDDTKIELHLVLHNSCSTDGTDEFIKTVAHSSVIVHPVNNIKYDETGSIVYVVKENWNGAINSVPDDVEWTWLMGDDDFIEDPNAVQYFSELVDQHPSVEFMHFCQSGRSKNSGKVISASLFELCNTLGFHEVLGWMSSILLKTSKFKEALNGELWKISRSAYGHSACILNTSAGIKSLFVDKPLVEPQDKVQSKESIERWKKDNVVEGYFYVIDDLKYLIDKKIIPAQVKPVFFRYLTYSLWDRYAAHLIGELVNTGALTEKSKQFFMKIQQIYSMLDGSLFKKQYALWMNNLYNRMLDYADRHEKLLAMRNQLKTEHSNQNVGVYQFSILDDNLGV